jgi:hypothetical protein
VTTPALRYSCARSSDSSVADSNSAAPLSGLLEQLPYTQRGASVSLTTGVA